MRKLFLICTLIFFGTLSVFSQTCSVNAGPDVTYLVGGSGQFNASGADFYSWSPTTGLSNPNIANPIVSGGAAGTTLTYTVTGSKLTTTNLITNGDFSAGNTGFSSDYVYTGPGPLTLNPEGKYGVGPNPNSYHWNFSACTDHTGGGGNMLIANASPVASERVWYTTVTVIPNTNYAFSAWVTTVCLPNPPTLQFKIAGQLLGSPTSFSGTLCYWEKFYQIWNSGSNTSVEISITNQNTIANGNDFAIDDISFFQLCTSTDEAVRYSKAPDPELTTTVVTNIFTKKATSGGNVTSQGQSAITTRGVCWNTTGTPTTANPKTADGTGIGSFPSLMTGLTGSTLYYVRAYVINTEGTYYGNQVTFTTQPPTKANNDSYTLNEDAPPTNLTIQTNDYYCLDGPVTTPLKLITNPIHGTASINNNGTPSDFKDDYVVYTPIANHHGSDNFIYEICDFYGDCVRATANITILSVDDFPNAQNNEFTIKQAIYGNTLPILPNDNFGGDVPFDGPGSWSIITQPTYGSLVIHNNGTPTIPVDDYVIYSPTNCYVGTDSFVYRICDPDGDCSTATVNLMIEVDLFNISKGFSPNGDGINDKFIIGDLTLYPNNSLTIINRWGNKVFEAKPYNNDWDGTAQMGVRLGGDEVPQGTYFFLFDPGNNTGVRKGHFYIKRK
jgi:gliding motility-associated-like protein